MVELVCLAKPVDFDVRTIQSSDAGTVGYYDVVEILQTTLRLAFAEQEHSLKRYREHLNIL